MYVEWNTVMVTRHKALVNYAVEIGVADPNIPVLRHVTEDDVRGRHVIGVLPLHLASVAASVTEIPLALTPEDRGRELSLERLREIAQPPRTYRVRPFEGPAFRPQSRLVYEPEDTM